MPALTEFQLRICAEPLRPEASMAEQKAGPARSRPGLILWTAVIVGAAVAVAIGVLAGQAQHAAPFNVLLMLLVVGVGIAELAARRRGVAVPLLSPFVPRLGVLWWPLVHVWARGSLAFLIIAVGLWVLARAERSRALAVIALAYTAAALLVSLYNVENIPFRLGWNPGRSAFTWQLTILPDVLLPAVVLLLAGLGALIASRRNRPAAGDGALSARRRVGPA
jgi:hypothetical protein